MTNSLGHILLFLNWIAGKSAAQLLEYLTINFREHHGRVNLTATQTGQLLQGFTTLFIVFRQYAEGYQYLICMQTWVLATQVFYLSLLYGFDQTLWNELGLVIDLCQMLHGIDEQSGAASQQWA